MYVFQASLTHEISTLKDKAWHKGGIGHILVIAYFRNKQF